MLHGIDSIPSMNRELLIRVSSAGMQFDCGAGGNFGSPIAVVSEAPGEREVALKSPLIGGSGKFLWDVLRRDNINRNHVYITNAVKRKLIGASDHHADARDGKITLTKQEFEHWKHILIDELSLLPNLKYVIALGNLALQALTGEMGIMNFRGSVLPVNLHGREVQVVCTYNPAFIMREPKLEVVFRMDCNKLTRVMNGQFNAPEINCLINPTTSEALDYITECKHSGVPIAHDIETMANETACVGLAMSDTEGMCINFRSQGENHYTLVDERRIRLSLQDLLDDPTQQFIAQNGNFDSYWMWFKDRIRVHSYWFDTMLAHHLLYPSLPHSLAFITAQYTDYPYYKDEGKEWREEGDIDSFWRYNVKDCCITRIAALKMKDELEAQGLSEFFFNHIMALQPNLVEMTVGGVLCDTALKRRIADDLATSVEQAKALCQEQARTATGIADYSFNPRSPRDLGDLFFSKLRLVGRGTSTDKENRDRMRKHPRTNEAARTLINGIDGYLTDAKFLSVYASAQVDEDQRFRCEYKQTGVSSAPGRLSSTQTAWGNGLNMQNIPERAKGMLIADPGYEFSYYDMSQIEARIVAYLADIPTWKEQFERARLNPGSYDAHCALASEMYGIPYDDVPKYDFEADGTKTIRFTAKRCRHGLNYRMGPDRLATTAQMSIGEAEAAYRIYHRASPQVMQWWDDTIALIRRDRMLVSVMGRRWLLLERFDESALDSVIAFDPQSTNGDHTASVIHKCHNDPRWPRGHARMLINVHDANICINRTCDGELVRSIMKEHAERPLLINSVKNKYDRVDKPEQLIVPADFGVSVPGDDGIHRWSTIKKIKAK